MPKRSIGSEDSEDELRASPSGTNGESPRAKRRKCVEFEPIRICSIGSVKEIENRVLLAQHYKLCERFKMQEKLRLELEKRIEGFERRQIQDDAVLCIINRYWNRLDEEIQLLLQRFDSETVQMDAEMKDEAANSTQHDDTHFLSVIAQWTCEEMDEKLKQRVEFSQRSLAKLVQAFSRIDERNGRIITLLRGGGESSAETDEANLETEKDMKKELSEGSPTFAEENGTTAANEGTKKKGNGEMVSIASIENELRKHTMRTLEENKRLQKMLTKMQAENHRLAIKATSHDDSVNTMALRVDSLTTEIEDLRYRLHKSMQREEKLDFRLAEYVKKQNVLQISATTAPSVAGESHSNGPEEELASLSKSKLEELQQELETQTELASNRLAELQEMTERNKALSADLENCKMKLKYISSDDVKNSTEYKCLQTAFNSLFEENKVQKKEVDELKQQIVQSKQNFEEQINSIKNDSLIALDRLQQTVIELDNDLNTARREYENVCVDYEVNTASREQAMPINEQMNALMNSLNTQNTQLKQEVARLKRKCNEMSAQVQMCQKELDGERRVNNDNYLIIKLDDETASGSAAVQLNNSQLAEGGTGQKAETDGVPAASFDGVEVKKEEPSDTASQNGQCNDQQHRNSSALSPPPPADLTEAQKIILRIRLERDRYKDKLRALARADLKEKRKSWTEEQRRRVKHLEDQCDRLRRELQSAKQEEDGLMQEMESTGQAFEELQEQHQKLVEQLREKDDINLKLMSERIRSTQAQKKMRDEKELLDQSIQSLENQLAAKLLHCQRLEEKERILSENRVTLEHELRIRDQNNETLRKKAMEFSQLATDLRLRLDRLDIQFTELRESVIKKASSYEANANKIKRLEEEKSSLKRKLDRSKRMEKYENVDELLQEENRILKESLTCPSCKVNRKNAILDKCHHVFCFECIRLRYDNRRRKCPKCNAAFGANDFHRIYLE